MAEVVKYFCDRCGKEVKENALGKVEVYWTRRENMPYLERELCRECLDLLERWMKIVVLEISKRGTEDEKHQV